MATLYNIATRKATGAILLSLVLLLAAVFVLLKMQQYQREAVVSKFVTEKKQIEGPLAPHLTKKTPFWSLSYDTDLEKKQTTIKVFSKSPYHRYQAYKFLRSKDPDFLLKYRIIFVNHTTEMEMAR